MATTPSSVSVGDAPAAGSALGTTFQEVPSQRSIRVRYEPLPLRRLPTAQALLPDVAATEVSPDDWPGLGLATTCHPAHAAVPAADAGDPATTAAASRLPDTTSATGPDSDLIGTTHLHHISERRARTTLVWRPDNPVRRAQASIVMTRHQGRRTGETTCHIRATSAR